MDGNGTTVMELCLVSNPPGAKNPGTHCPPVGTPDANPASLAYGPKQAASVVKLGPSSSPLEVCACSAV